jgi:hypothetical protein
LSSSRTSFAFGDPYSTRLSYNIAIPGDIASAEKSESPNPSDQKPSRASGEVFHRLKSFHGHGMVRQSAELSPDAQKWGLRFHGYGLGFFFMAFAERFRDLHA